MLKSVTLILFAIALLSVVYGQSGCMMDDRQCATYQEGRKCISNSCSCYGPAECNEPGTYGPDCTMVNYLSRCGVWNGESCNKKNWAHYIGSQFLEQGQKCGCIDDSGCTKSLWGKVCRQFEKNYDTESQCGCNSVSDCPDDKGYDCMDGRCYEKVIPKENVEAFTLECHKDIDQDEYGWAMDDRKKQIDDIHNRMSAVESKLRGGLHFRKLSFENFQKEVNQDMKDFDKFSHNLDAADTLRTNRGKEVLESQPVIDYQNTECVVSSDCGEGKHCNQQFKCKKNRPPQNHTMNLVKSKTSVDHCMSDSECSNGQECNSDFICVDKAVHCMGDAECSNGQECSPVDFVCVDKAVHCMGDAECLNGQECSPVDFVCVAKAVTVHCMSSDECKLEEKCENSVCVPRWVIGQHCDNAMDCAGWMVCGMNNTCEEKANGQNGANSSSQNQQGTTDEEWENCKREETLIKEIKYLKQEVQMLKESGEFFEKVARIMGDELEETQSEKELYQGWKEMIEAIEIDLETYSGRLPTKPTAHQLVKKEQHKHLRKNHKKNQKSQ